MATSEVFPVKVGSDLHNVSYYIDVIQEQQNNISLTSAVAIKVKFLNANSEAYKFDGKLYVYVGDVVYVTDVYSQLDGQSETTFFNKTLVIPHDADGYKEDFSVRAYILANEILKGQGEVTSEEQNGIIVSLDKLDPATISDELATNGENEVRYRVRVDQVNVNSNGMTSKILVSVLAYPNELLKTVRDVNGEVKCQINDSIYIGCFDTPIFSETGAVVFSKQIDIKHDNYDPLELVVLASVDAPSYSITSNLQGFTTVLPPVYVDVTSPDFFTSTPYLYYNINVKQNSVNKEGLVSSVTVKVQIWCENSTAYLFTGRVYCQIDGMLYSVDLTQHKINDTVSTLFEKTLVIPHEDNGLKMLTVSAYMKNLNNSITSEEQTFVGIND